MQLEKRISVGRLQTDADGNDGLFLELVADTFKIYQIAVLLQRNQVTDNQAVIVITALHNLGYGQRITANGLTQRIAEYDIAAVNAYIVKISIGRIVIQTRLKVQKSCFQ